ncbi:MAG: DUF2280 domain-containing protein [Bacteroidetes bacterium]|jgi:hypothetical protein|nr:DUF2280 domain-containing protein [Bacteroidota bacterium]
MRLDQKHKVFIVERLACYDTPTEVQTAFQERFGERISLSQIVYYDPTSSQGRRELAQDWKDLFAETRQRFTRDTSEIAIAQKAYRLRRLGRIARQAAGMRNYVLEMDALEQAAKEVGDAYTNSKKVDVTSGGDQITGVVFTSPGEGAG